MALVIDTGPLVAALDRSDQSHDQCAALLRDCTERRVIPAPVLVEVDDFSAKIGPHVFTALLDDIGLGAFDVEPLTEHDYRRIRALLDDYADLSVGFVDAAVLAVVERLGERKLATLDRRHFSVMRPAGGPIELVP